MAKTASYPRGARTAPPLHPGEIIAGLIEDVGISAREAARSLGVNHQALANVLNGKSAISPEMAVRLQAFMANGDEGAEFWLRLQAEYDLWHARRALKAEIAKIKPAPREPKVA
jgi:antitoxin HigA-1